MAIGGVEYHGHTWEFGARKAKELLFTAGYIDADEAHRLGMVNKVVPLDELHDATLTLANEIAQMHTHGLMMAKRAVNQPLDAQGQYVAIQACFRSQERRVGKECVSTCTYRWTQYQSTKNTTHEQP